MRRIINLTREEFKEILIEALGEYEERKKKPKKAKENNELYNMSINILNFLNLRCKTNFKDTTTNLKLISTSLSSKDISVSEAIGIINMKYDEWNDSDMKKFLRPATLFNATNRNNYCGLLENKYKFNENERLIIFNTFRGKELSKEELKIFLVVKNTNKGSNEEFNVLV